jgi:tetratricopeptide (TPR) repeat protein
MLKSPYVPAEGTSSHAIRGLPAAAGNAAPRAERRSQPAEMTDAIRDAIDRCRRGAWKEGVPALARIAEQEERPGALPALVYSYLGYGIALRQQRLSEGLKLCQHAVKLEFYQAENYLNLARTQLLAGYRRAAVRAVADGLKIEPDNPQLLELELEVGRRRRPVLSFLSRSNPCNLLLGRIRHLLAPRRH